MIDICRGIEVGHVFQLGTKYSEAMNATCLDETGKPRPMEMGCYGIGVTRILGAAIEQNFDDKGIIWPESIAPFEVVLCPMGYDRSEAVREQADKLYAELVEAGVDVILDDRGERPGVMFADWELIGVPHRLVIGDRGLKEGKLEYQGRRDAEATLLPVEDAAQTVIGEGSRSIGALSGADGGVHLPVCDRPADSDYRPARQHSALHQLPARGGAQAAHGRHSPRGGDRLRDPAGRSWWSANASCA